jgi:hypothetical protein
MVPLLDGRVLVAGGRSPGPVGWSETEVFDPATSAFTPSSELLVTRWNAPGVLLPGGDVVLVGGETNSASLDDATAVQRWDTATGVWSIAGHLLENRVGLTATLLSRGDILVVGGLASDPELFDPGSGQSRRPAGRMVHPRVGHTATLLSDGRVLLAGGWSFDLGTTLEAEVFDPRTESFAPAGLLQADRGYHVAQRLADGRVLVAGGVTVSGAPVASAEIWDPASGEFRPTGSLAAGRALATAALLADGSVLIAGGLGLDNLAFAEIEVFDPALGRWTRSASLPSPRTGVALATLQDGRVLITGGSPDGGFPVLAAELFE